MLNKFQTTVLTATAAAIFGSFSLSEYYPFCGFVGFLLSLLMLPTVLATAPIMLGFSDTKFGELCLRIAIPIERFYNLIPHNPYAALLPTHLQQIVHHLHSEKRWRGGDEALKELLAMSKPQDGRFADTITKLFFSMKLQKRDADGEQYLREALKQVDLANLDAEQKMRLRSALIVRLADALNSQKKFSDSEQLLEQTLSEHPGTLPTDRILRTMLINELIDAHIGSEKPFETIISLIIGELKSNDKLTAAIEANQVVLVRLLFENYFAAKRIKELTPHLVRGLTTVAAVRDVCPSVSATLLRYISVTLSTLREPFDGDEAVAVKAVNLVESAQVNVPSFDTLSCPIGNQNMHFIVAGLPMFDDPIAHILNLTGVFTFRARCYRERGEYDEAVTLLEKVVKLQDKVPDKEVHLMATHLDLSGNLRRSGRFSEAEFNLLKSRDFAVHLGEKYEHSLANISTNLARLYIAEGKFAEAQAEFDTVFSLFETNTNILTVVKGRRLVVQSLLAYHHGDRAEAEVLFEKSLEVLRTSGHFSAITSIRDAVNDYAKFLIDDGRVEEAEAMKQRNLEETEKELASVRSENG